MLCVHENLRNSTPFNNSTPGQNEHNSDIYLEKRLSKYSEISIENAAQSVILMHSIHMKA